jgi:1-deoxy-D-xylulose-5-phosphate reductoisomerase
MRANFHRNRNGALKLDWESWVAWSEKPWPEFKKDRSQIEVVIHPQSVIHSMVAYADGSVLAQLGNPDMRTPIAHALAYPERIDSGVDAIDLARIGQLEFRQPDRVRFPCLQLAFDALQAGGSAPAVLNAANEVAVQAFLDKQISFSRISTLIAETLSRVPAASVDTLESLLATLTSINGAFYAGHSGSPLTFFKQLVDNGG